MTSLVALDLFLLLVIAISFRHALRVSPSFVQVRQNQQMVLQ